MYPFMDVCDTCLAKEPKQEEKSLAFLTPRHCDVCGAYVTAQYKSGNAYRLHRINSSLLKKATT